MNTIPIYYRSGYAARNAGELDQYRASHHENIRTRNVIDAAIREHFDGFHLRPMALHSVLASCDPDRVALVLANTLRWRDCDGRFSQASRSWAAGIRTPDAYDPGADTTYFWACQSHSAILEGFISAFRRWEKECTAEAFGNREEANT